MNFKNLLTKINLISENTGATDFSGTRGEDRKQVLADLAASDTHAERSKHAERARRAGASQTEIETAINDSFEDDTNEGMINKLPTGLIHTRDYDDEGDSEMPARRGRPEHTDLDDSGIDDLLAAWGMGKPSNPTDMPSRKHRMSDEEPVTEVTSNITIEPAQQSTQVIKQGNKVLGSVTDPKLAGIVKQAIGTGTMTLAGDQAMQQMKEEEMTSADKAKEEKLKGKYDKSGMKAAMIKQYGPEKGEQVYFATIRKQAMKEGMDDQLDEKWDSDYKTPKAERGKYAGKTIEELEDELDTINATGPHERNSREDRRRKEIQFAIRAKRAHGGKWTNPVEENMADSVMESWENQLSALLKEDMTITTTTSNKGQPSSVSINATDADADELMKLVQAAGLSGNADQPQGAVVVEPVASDEVLDQLKADQVDGGDGEEDLDFLKKMLGNRGAEQCDEEEACDEADNFAATQGAGQVGGGSPSVLPEEDEEKEESETCNECGHVMEEGHECSEMEDKDTVTEWANSPVGMSEDEQFEADMAFMTKMISGGLNNMKQDQTLANNGARVVTGADRADGQMSMAERLRRLDGIN